MKKRTKVEEIEKGEGALGDTQRKILKERAARSDLNLWLGTTLRKRKSQMVPSQPNLPK